MDRQEKAFEFASDTNKQLISLSVGSVALTVTFAKDVFGGLSSTNSGWLLAGWIIHLFSVLAGLLALMAHVGTLAKTEKDVYSANIVVCTIGQVLAFLVGLASGDVRLSPRERHAAEQDRYCSSADIGSRSQLLD